jgi:prenylcysteine oxidase/farnesylcysteine lyase
MLGKLAASTLLLPLIATCARGESHVVPEPEAAPVKQVAIIGAGAAGSSAAFHLSRLAEGTDSPVNVNITVFERTPRIGGRTLTVSVYGEPSMPLELGGSVFVAVNSIIYGAVKEFGLPLRDFDEGVMAVWDGQSFVYEEDDDSSWWWNIGRLMWKYGISPYRTYNLVKSTVATFLRMYEPPFFPFRSLSQVALDLRLDQFTTVTGEQLLKANGISDTFSRDIVQAATRVNYASDLANIHGLETMVSMAADGAMAVLGGNWQVFATMLQRCNATCNVLRETAVSSIAKAKAHHDSSDEAPAKYIISTHSAAEVGDSEDHEYPVEFDSVVIATPWQYADIAAAEGLMSAPIDKIPYTRLHVTLLTTSLTLSPEHFGLAPDTKMPRAVLTTVSPDGTVRPDFFSISVVGKFTNPKTGSEELAYKIFSPKEVTPEFLSSILGAPIPDTFTSQHGSDSPISWYYPHVFHSYPIMHPRVTFQDPVLADGLYYTSGIESFISTMETSSLMGKNVAHLVFHDLVGKEEAPSSGRGEDMGQDQKVLGTEFKDMGDGAPAGGDL